MKKRNNKKDYKKTTLNFLEGIAKLSNLQINKSESSYFPEQFEKTLNVVKELGKLNTSGVSGTYHVTGLKNILREDRIDPSRILSQSQALSNTKKSYKGFFVVKAIFDSEL